MKSGPTNEMKPTEPTFNSIDVLGKRFTMRELEPGEKEDCDGYMDLAAQVIAWRPQPGDDYNHDTVFHELTHAVDEILLLGLKERQVHLIASGLLAVLKQNKKLAEWLLK